MGLKKKVIWTTAILALEMPIVANKVEATVKVTPAKSGTIILTQPAIKKSTKQAPKNKPKVSSESKAKKATNTKVKIEPIEEEEQLSNTIVSKSLVHLNKKASFYDSFGKKLKKTAKKGASYRIYQIKTLDNHTYYKTKSDLWLLAKDTNGEVWYKQNLYNTMILTTSKRGKLSYAVYAPTPTVINLMVKHNAYVYTSRGQLKRSKHGTVTLIKKGKLLKGYSVKKVAGKKFYITNRGWIKYNNLEKVKIRKK